jgi:hypothetical protein
MSGMINVNELEMNEGFEIVAEGVEYFFYIKKKAYSLNKQIL